MTGVVIALGDEFRHDDGVGPALARSLCGADLPAPVLLPRGDPLALIDGWDGASAAVIVDAIRSTHPQPGRVHVLEACEVNDAAPAGTHGFGLGAVIALGAALGKMPTRLVVVGVEVADVTPGRGLSPAVACAGPAVVAAVQTALSAERSRPRASDPDGRNRRSSPEVHRRRGSATGPPTQGLVAPPDDQRQR